MPWINSKLASDRAKRDAALNTILQAIDLWESDEDAYDSSDFIDDVINAVLALRKKG